MRWLRWLQLAAVAFVMVGVAPKAHAIVHLELEAGGGLNLRGPQAPMATAGVRLNVLSLLDVGLRGEYVFGGEPQLAGGGAQGYQAWMVFPEIRLSTPTPFIKFDLSLGGGLGNLKGVNLNAGQMYDANDGAKPYGQIGIGIKVGIPTTDVYVRAEGSAGFFTSVAGPDIGDGLNPGILPMYQAMIMLGYEGIGF